MADPDSHVILVVEDDAGIREGVADSLSRRGYRVLIANDGREGLAEARRSDPPPSLIVLDWMMPVMSGHDFLRERALDDRLRAIPVVVFTAVDRVLEIDDGQVAAILGKPIRMRTLGDVIDRLCGVPRRSDTVRMEAIPAPMPGSTTVPLRRPPR